MDVKGEVDEALWYGVYGARFIATEEGFAVKEMIATDDGIIGGITMSVPKKDIE